MNAADLAGIGIWFANSPFCATNHYATQTLNNGKYIDPECWDKKQH